jgi:protein phosphatase
MKVPIEGNTPLWRYGHSIVYIMPILILFGGSGKNEIVNDIWILYTDKSPFKWEKINVNGNYPPPKVYHTSNIFKIAEQQELMVAFGGRGSDGVSHNDLTGLRKSSIKNNEWEWVDLSRGKNYNGDINPIARHQVISHILTLLALRNLSRTLSLCSRR